MVLCSFRVNDTVTSSKYTLSRDVVSSIYIQFMLHFHVNDAVKSPQRRSLASLRSPESENTQKSAVKNGTCATKETQSGRGRSQMKD